MQYFNGSIMVVLFNGWPDHNDDYLNQAVDDLN